MKQSYYGQHVGDTEGAFLQNEPGSVGVYNRILADHPANQGRLGCTIGTWLTTQRTRVGWKCPVHFVKLEVCPVMLPEMA